MYTYYGNTNRLSFITDNAPAASKANGWNKTSAPVVTTLHLYDANGNMKYDPAKGMDVAYNHLNLPNRMSWTNLNTSLTKEIKILYDGGGRKLQKRVIEENGTLVYQQDYVSGIEYRTTPTKALTLEAIPHTEGRMYNTNVTSASTTVSLRYEYTIKDHLGNARLSFTDKNTNGVVDVTNTAANEVLQENHYYPFGLNMSGPWMNDAALDNRYQYNGKELNDDFGLNWNDYGARWYDATVGRFPSVDPIIEKFPYLTPYNYASNNPVTMIDLWGLQGISFQGIVNQITPSFNNKVNEYASKALEGLKSAGEYAEKLLTFTDANDAVVIGTAITGDAKNADGSDASSLDVGAAVLGAAIPFVAGSVLTKGDDFFEFFIDWNKHPESADHLQQAIDSGKKTEGVLDRAGSAKRRKENMEGHESEKGFDRDEAPPAIMDTGEKSSVKKINPSDNRGSGSSIGRQLKDVPDGTKVKITPKNVPKA